MLTVEEKLKTLQMTERQVEEISLAYYEYEMNRSKTQEQKNAWAALSVRKKSKLIKTNLQEGMVQDFQLWLQGRSKYNVKTTTERKFNPINNKFEETERECTPWGNKSLLHLNDVCEWLKLPVMNRDKVAKAISILKMTTPNNIDEAWIYYKYIVRGLAIDGAVLKEQRYYNVFDYIEKRPTRPQLNDLTGEMEEVEDMNFTPGSIDNPSMPKFNKQAYQNNYNNFNNQINMGNVYKIVDENELFSGLTPDDKLALLIKAMAFAEECPVLEMPPPIRAGVPEVVPVGVPVARKDATPFIVAEMANTLAAAIGKSFEKATDAQKKTSQEVLKILQMTRNENLKAFNVNNDVLLKELGVMNKTLDEIRKVGITTGKSNAELLRRFKDDFRVIDAAIRRDAPAPAPKRLAAQNMVMTEAVNVEPLIIKPAIPPKPAVVKPMIAPAIPLELERAVVVERARRPEDLPRPAIGDVINKMPDPVEEPVAVPIPAEIPENFVEIQAHTIPGDRLFPRVSDGFNSVNQDLRKLQKNEEVIKSFSTMVNTTIMQDVMSEIVKKSNLDTKAMVKMVNEEAVNIFDQKVSEFKGALEKSPLVRAIAFNHLPRNETLKRDFVESIYGLTKDSTVDEKLGKLSRIHTHLAAAPDYADVVPGFTAENVASRVQTALSMTLMAGLEESAEVNKDDLKRDILDRELHNEKSPSVAQEELVNVLAEKHNYATHGKAMLAALNTATSQSEEFKRQRDQLLQEKQAVQELLGSPDGDIAENIKEALERNGKYKVYTEQQAKEIEELREYVQETERLTSERESLLSEMENMRTQNSDQARINNEVVGTMQTYRQNIEELQNKINNVTSQLEHTQNEMQAKVFNYENAVAQLKGANENNQMARINAERQIIELQQKHSQLIDETNQKMQMNQNTIIALEQKLQLVQGEYLRLQGPEIQNRIGELEKEKAVLDNQMGQERKHHEFQNNQLQQQIRELQERARAAERATGVANEEKQQLELKLRENETALQGLTERYKEETMRSSMQMGNVTFMREQLKGKLDPLLEETYKNQLKTTEEALARSATMTQNMDLEIKNLRLQNEALKGKMGNPEQVGDLLNQISKISEQKEELGNKLKEKTQEYEKRLQKMRTDIETAKSDLKGRVPTAEMKKLQGKMEEMKKTIESYNKANQDLEKMKNNAITSNKTKTEQLNAYVKDLEAKYKRSDGTRRAVERLLAGRRQTMQQLDALGDRFNNALKYLAVDNISENIEDLFSYKDDEKAAAETKAGRALINSWSALHNLQEQKTKDIEVIKEQGRLLKQYEQQISTLKKKHVETVGSYEERLHRAREINESIDPEGKEIAALATKTEANVTDYATVAKQAATKAQDFLVHLEKKGGKRSLITEDEFQSLSGEKKSVTASLINAVNERSQLESYRIQLETEKEKIYEGEAELMHMNRMLTAEQKHQVNVSLANIERKLAVVERGTNKLEEHIKTFKTTVDFYGNLLSGKTVGTSKKEAIETTTTFYSQVKAGSVETAKTAALNIMETYTDAIRTTPNLLYSLSQKQLLDYANVLSAAMNKMKTSNDPDTIQVMKRASIEIQALKSISEMSEDRKKQLNDNQYESAYKKQKEIKEMEGTKADMEDTLLTEGEERGEYANEDFAPSYSQQQVDSAEMQRIIKKATVEKAKLTEDEAIFVDEYIATHGGRYNKTIYNEIMEVLRQKITDTYMELIDKPENDINLMFVDRNDALLYQAGEIAQYQGLVRKTMNELHEIAKSYGGDDAQEKNAKIIQALSSKSPEMLADLVTGTVFANSLNKDIKVGLSKSLLADLKKYAIREEAKIEDLQESLNYLAESITNHSADPQAFNKFITAFETELGKQPTTKKYIHSGPSHARPMNFFLNRGELENQSMRDMGNTFIHGIDSDTLAYVNSANPSGAEQLSNTFKQMNDMIPTEGGDINTGPYVEMFKNISLLSKRAVTNKLHATGNNVYKSTIERPTPEIKRLFDNLKAYESIITTLDTSKYGSDKRTKVNVIKAIRNASKAALYDTQRALRDVDRLKVRNKTENTITTRHFASAIVNMRHEAKNVRNKKTEWVPGWSAGFAV